MKDTRLITFLGYFLVALLFFVFAFALFGCTADKPYPCECDEVIYTQWDNVEINRFELRYNELLCDTAGDTIANNLKYYSIIECHD